MEVLSFLETKRLLNKYKLPFCETEIFDSKEKAIDYAQKLGYPVVLKIHGPQIFHKSELGGVKVNINNDEELSKAWNEMIDDTKDKQIEGILVQEMVNGNEVAIGMERDEQFGSVLMFGLGGIFIEIIGDVSLRIAPVDKEEALKMIKEVKGYRILSGYRGREPADIDKLADIICNVSQMAIKEKEIKSIDFNPIIIDKNNACIADTRIII